jgi:glycosyltransferase involved in cell wall biosynthesis
MDPLVSVIIPNYNHAAFLRERIESVLAQDFKDFEIILLDDCSTDGSRDILQHYAHHPKCSHVVTNEQNSGSPFLQWTKGISLARGEYIWIAESDDVAAVELLGTLVTEMEKNRNSVIAFVHSRLIDKNNKQLSYGWNDNDSREVNCFEGHEFVMKKMLTSNYIYNASMAIFRKSAYQLIDTSYQQYSYCGDWVFWIELCLKGDVIEVCRVLNSYRQHQGQTTLQSVKNGKKWLEMGYVLKRAADLLALTDTQRRCLCGRYTKRFMKENIPNKSEILSVHKDMFGGSPKDICYYEIGKMFDFLRS